MLFFICLLINSLVYATQPSMHRVDISRIEASEGEDISNKPPEVVEGMCLKWDAARLMKTFKRLCHESIKMFSDFQMHVQKRYKDERVQGFLVLIGNQNECKSTSPADPNIPKNNLNKENLSVFYKKTQDAFDKLLEEYVSKDPESNILNNSKNFVYPETLITRLSPSRIRYGFMPIPSYSYHGIFVW
ncbi:hypothetical protein THOM_2337 [Trachipleistophora hominis]|uniref:Secreted protein n=1 Tax=Trachipleistophora hominis TaxID=72359 RepID=L7JTK5_TRAHO|nr:hypothetical protein THOM_2337 [Trachipleistophora hominis]